MKNWLLAAIFIVTWNEYALIPYHTDGIYEGDKSRRLFIFHTVKEPQDFYRVEITTHTVKLATQKDLFLFLGYNWKFPNAVHTNHLLTEKAFNISVKEIKE